jgi:hypothetical protein
MLAKHAKWFVKWEHCRKIGLTSACTDYYFCMAAIFILHLRNAHLTLVTLLKGTIY